MGPKSATCTWIVQGTVGTDTREVECGNPAYLEFTRRITSMGRPVIERFPRCRKHAPPRVVKQATEGFFLGDQHYVYDVKFLEE